MKKISLLKISLYFCSFLFFILLTTNVVHATEEWIFNPISVAEYSIFRIQDRHKTFPYGEVFLGGVKFIIPEEGLNLAVTNFGDPAGEFLPHTLTFSAEVNHPNAVYLLINGGNTYVDFDGQPIGEIKLIFEDDSTSFQEIIAGYNFRDWNLQNPFFAIATLDSDSNTKEVTPPGAEIPTTGDGRVAIDMMKIEIPQEYKNKKLKKIVIFDTSSDTVQSPNPAIAIYGITVTSNNSPTIFLPGMTACWNGQAMLTGNEADDWNLHPVAYAKFYRDLIESFNAAGLQENKDWYLFCYDWRRPLEYNAEKLKNFIDNKVKPTNKVNLVGHSMGGLVSRSYVQLYPHLADKVITVGSPHQGAVRVYPAWEGGLLLEYDSLLRSLMELLLFFNRQPGESQMKTIRRVIPSMKDLLPTFDFLEQADSHEIKDINTHIHQNDFLNSLNPMPDSIKPLFNTVHGFDQPTLEKIKVS